MGNSLEVLLLNIREKARFQTCDGSPTPNMPEKFRPKHAREVPRLSSRQRTKHVPREKKFQTRICYPSIVNYC